MFESRRLDSHVMGSNSQDRPLPLAKRWILGLPCGLRLKSQSRISSHDGVSPVLLSLPHGNDLKQRHSGRHGSVGRVLQWGLLSMKACVIRMRSVIISLDSWICDPSNMKYRFVLIHECLVNSCDARHVSDGINIYTCIEANPLSHMSVESRLSRLSLLGYEGSSIFRIL